MLNILSLKIPKKGKIFVKELESVCEGSVLMEGEEEGEREVVCLCEVFKIPPSQIFKVLLKKLGDKVKKGEVLAKKEGIFGKVVLKSPIDGRLTEISQALGQIALAEKEKKVVVKSPVSGKIKEVKKEEIKIEFEGMVFGAKKGGGERAFGVIENLPPEVSVLDLSGGIGKKILVGEIFSPPVLAKALVLEVEGLVGASFSQEPPPLPFLIVEKKDLKSLRGYQEKKAILDPLNKRLIILFD